MRNYINDVPVVISMTQVTTNRGERWVCVKIVDRRSTYTVAEINMSAEQFMRFMGNSIVDVTAAIPDDEGRERLHRTMTTQTTRIPDAVCTKQQYVARDLDAIGRVSIFAQRPVDDGDWDEYRINANSQAFTITWSRWADPVPEADAEL